MRTTPHFPIERIDFQVKRLGLTHNPRIKTTIEGASCINEISKAILKWKKSLLPKAKRTKNV